jgi:hypothetical protein
MRLARCTFSYIGAPIGSSTDLLVDPLDIGIQLLQQTAAITKTFIKMPLKTVMMINLAISMRDVHMYGVLCLHLHGTGDPGSIKAALTRLRLP